MKTPLSESNPCGHNRYGFAWEQVPASASVHIDFGCSNGRFLTLLQNRGIPRVIGVDACGPAIEAARKKLPKMEFVHVQAGQGVPLPNGQCDSVSMLDVLEHISDQAAVLAEVHRILKDCGLFIVTVPRKHIFSFLDLGNLKFLFPRLHKLHFRLRHSAQEYKRRYVSNPDGLVGDVAVEKQWHEHFSPNELKTLLEESGFETLKIDGTGFFERLVAPMGLCIRWIPGVRKLLARFYAWDARTFESSNLFCLARKNSRPPHT